MLAYIPAPWILWEMVMFQFVIWVVVSNMNFIFPFHIWDVILPKVSDQTRPHVFHLGWFGSGNLSGFAISAGADFQTPLVL